MLAIHLILLAVNKLKPTLSGSAQIYSDCLGALRNVEHLPPHRIPSSSRHSDILKNIMIHCRSLSFSTVFSHVSAHKLDHLVWDELTRPEQLNEQCDSGAKLAIYDVDPNAGMAAQPLPLEPICVYVDRASNFASVRDVLANWRVAGMVFIGGSIGTMLRYLLHEVIAARHEFPTSELLALTFVNLFGSYFLGVTARHPIFDGERRKAFFATGFAGGFTTMSALTVFIDSEGLSPEIALMLFVGVICYAIGWHQGRRAAKRRAK